MAILVHHNEAGEGVVVEQGKVLVSGAFRSPPPSIITITNQHLITPEVTVNARAMLRQHPSDLSLIGRSP